MTGKTKSRTGSLIDDETMNALNKKLGFSPFSSTNVLTSSNNKTNSNLSGAGGSHSGGGASRTNTSATSSGMNPSITAIDEAIDKVNKTSSNSYMNPSITAIDEELYPEETLANIITKYREETKNDDEDTGDSEDTGSSFPDFTPLAVTPFTFGSYSPNQSVTDAYNDYVNHSATRPNEWSGGTYAQSLQSAMDSINNREQFSYDLNADALYQQYKNQYMNEGKLAMQDTLGKASALTGGYGNSYAVTAGNQAYQGYLNKLNAVVPQLYQLAYDKYNNETNDLYNKYNMYKDAYNTEYDQYRDTVSDWYTENNRLKNDYQDARDFDYGVYTDDYSKALSEHKDKVSQDQFNQELAYKQAMAKLEQQNWEREMALKESQAKTSGQSDGSTSSGTSDYIDVLSQYVPYNSYEDLKDAIEKNHDSGFSSDDEYYAALKYIDEQKKKGNLK